MKRASRGTDQSDTEEMVDYRGLIKRLSLPSRWKAPAELVGRFLESPLQKVVCP
jgi:hypothetical protein